MLSMPYNNKEETVQFSSTLTSSVESKTALQNNTDSNVVLVSMKVSEQLIMFALLSVLNL